MKTLQRALMATPKIVVNTNSNSITKVMVSVIKIINFILKMHQFALSSNSAKQF